MFLNSRRNVILSSLPVFQIDVYQEVLPLAEYGSGRAGSWEVTGIIVNVVLVNSGFKHAKEFLWKLSLFGYAPSKMFASPVLGRRSFKYIGFHRCQIRPISLLEAPVFMFSLITNITGITITSSTNRTVGENTWHLLQLVWNGNVKLQQGITDREGIQTNLSVFLVDVGQTAGLKMLNGSPRFNNTLQ